MIDSDAGKKWLLRLYAKILEKLSSKQNPTVIRRIRIQHLAVQQALQIEDLVYSKNAAHSKNIHNGEEE